MFGGNETDEKCSQTAFHEEFPIVTIFDNSYDMGYYHREGGTKYHQIND